MPLSLPLAILLGSAISAASAGVGTAVSAVSRRKSEERQNQYNLDAEQRQQGYIDDQNRYNSPKEQMNRYREAGLNPYLVDDPGNQGTINEANVSQAADVSDILQQGISETGSRIADGVTRFQSAMLDEKKYNLDVAKLDFQRTELEAKQKQFEEKMSLDRAGFDRLQRRDEIEDAYRAARDQVKDDYDQQILQIRQSELDLATQKEETRRLESQRDYDLRALDSYRRGQIHELQKHAMKTENKYNDDMYEFFEKYELPNKKVQARIESLIYDMSDEEQKEFVKCARETFRLKSLQTSNQISYEEYVRDARKLWDASADRLFKTKNARYLRGEGLNINPYTGMTGGRNAFLEAADEMMKFVK